MIAATLLERGLLFLPLVLNFPIGLVCIVSLAVIRSAESSELAASARKDVQGDDGEGYGNDSHTNRGNSEATHSIRHSARVLGEVLRDPVILVLLATVPVAKAVNPIGELTWQYIPKKYGISFAEVRLLPKVT